MSFGGEVESPQPVSGEAVCSSLEQDCLRPESCEDLIDYRLEHIVIVVIVHSIGQWAIDGVVLASLVADVLHRPSSGEVFPELVKGKSHYSICSVKRFFYSISVMDIDVDVEHSLMVL